MLEDTTRVSEYPIKKSSREDICHLLVFCHPSEWIWVKQRWGKMAHHGLDVLKSAIIMLAD